jgi:hypothetical protein
VGDEDPEDERRGEKVAALARRLTEHSTYSLSGQNPFTPEPDSTRRCWPCKETHGLRTTQDRHSPEP